LNHGFPDGTDNEFAGRDPDSESGSRPSANALTRLAQDATGYREKQICVDVRKRDDFLKGFTKV